MTLRTVKVPPSMEGAFEAAEAVVSSYFQKRIGNPEQGTIEISGERYVLVRAASLSVEFFELVAGREAGSDRYGIGCPGGSPRSRISSQPSRASRGLSGRPA